MTRQLREFVDVLRSRGSDVVLFEMPMHPDVCAAEGVVHMRRAISLALSPETYRQLPPPDCGEYGTTDGLHLSSDGAMLFAETLFQELQIRGWYIEDSL